MGDWTPSTPALLPTEVRPTGRTANVISPGSGIAMRIRPGAVTLSHVHLRLDDTATLGLTLEVVSSLGGIPGAANYLPGTDVVTTNWTRSTGAGTWASHVDDVFDTSDYLHTSTAASVLALRGAGSALSGQRIYSIGLGYYVRLYNTVTGIASAGFPFTVGFNIGGSYYSVKSAVTEAGWTYGTATMGRNPTTYVPWTQAEANLLIQAAGTDEIWMQAGAVPLANERFEVASFFMTVAHGAENRFGYYANYASIPAGWNKVALTAPVVFAANTWYYAVVAPHTSWVLFTSTTGDSVVNSAPVSISSLTTPGVIEAAGAAATTGEHRRLYTGLMTDGAALHTQVASDPIALVPMLFDSSGTIRGQSQPYVECDEIAVYSGVPTAALGQEITTTGTPPSYGAVKIAAGWQSSLRPNAALLVKLRTTSFAGTVIATATIETTDLPSSSVADLQVPFDTPVTPGASTKHYLTIESAATSGRGWKVIALDTRSDIVTTTTVAEVEGAGFNGQTDGASLASSTVNDRYDLSVSIVSAPTAPAGFSATPAAAA